MTPEGRTKARILAALPFLGVKAWHTPAGTRGGGRTRLAPPGTPDILGYRLRDGRMVAIEVKAPKGKPSDVQAAWLETAKASGVICGMAWSVEDVVRLLGIEAGA